MPLKMQIQKKIFLIEKKKKKRKYKFYFRGEKQVGSRNVKELKLTLTMIRSEMWADNR